jgi:hypothetical protein
LKKPYNKPTITFESLALSTNIAAGCAFISTNSAEYICPVIDEESGWTIFSDKAVCMMTLKPGDTICYDIPLANSNIFES